MSLLIQVHPDGETQEWKIGQPFPKLAGSCTKFYASESELVAIVAAIEKLSAPSSTPGQQCESDPLPVPKLRPIEDIISERDLISPLARRVDFSEQQLAQTLMTVLSWVLGQCDTGKPSYQFGWISLSIKQLSEDLGHSVSPEAILDYIVMKQSEVKKQ